MMHTTCLHSALSLRCRGPVSLSFNDSSYLLDDRFERNPLLIPSLSSSSCSCCCCCCAANNSIYTRLPIANPSFLYNGLRQSTLIQWSPCKRLIFHGRRRQYCDSTSGFSARDSDRDCHYEKISSLKERRKQGRLGKVRYKCRGFEDERKKQFFSNVDGDDYVDDVEVLLSLLTEEVGLEYIGVRERRRIEERENKKGTCYQISKKKNVCSSVSKRDLKRDSKIVEVRSGEEEDKRQRKEREEEQRENILRRENNVVRKEGSSCSSYYSLSSAGEFESDDEVEITHDGYYVEGESSSRYKNERTDQKRRNDDEDVENIERRQDYVKEQGVVLKKNDTAERYYGESVGVSHDWRKKSEKKLNEESNQDRSIISLNINEVNSQVHSQKVERITDQSESRMKYKHFMEMSERDDFVTGSSFSSQKRYSDTKNNLTASVEEVTGGHKETTERINRENEYRRLVNMTSKVSESEETEIRGTAASSLSETRMKNWEDNSTEAFGRVDDYREEKVQKTGHLTGLADTRVKLQQVSGISDSSVTNTKNTSVSHRNSDIRMEKQEEYSETFSSETKVAEAQRVANRRTSFEDKYLVSGVKLLKEATERHDKMDEGVLQTETTKAGRRTTKASSFNIGMQKEASSPYKALKLNPVPTGQEWVAHGSGKSSSLPMDIGSSSKQLSRGQSNVELTHEHSSEYLDSFTGELHEERQDGSEVQQSEIIGRRRSGDSRGEPLSFISQEDTLASADRQQKSSMHVVGEFVEKARHELSTSEIQQENKTHEAKFVYEKGEQYELTNLGQDGSGNSRPKDDGSRRSSQGSGPKGPSDEMWHVTDATIQEPQEIVSPETDAPETEARETEAPDDSSSSGNGAAVKRSGRSLWNIIGDVVRLRWVSPRSETHTSKSRGGKGSSNESTSSEVWFSGHEADESNEEHVKTGHRKGRSRSQREASSSSNSKLKVEHEGLDSPSNINKGSSSRSTSSPVIEESSFPAPAIRMRRSPGVKITSEAGETDASGSGKMVKMEQPFPKNLTEISPADASASGKSTEQTTPNLLTEISPTDVSSSGKVVKVDQPVATLVTEADSKDEELKRRKLARIDQVRKDRFDEWEEAYNLEIKQRKIDEMFMKEALLEAKKAADVWEVPVGAVLVQGGKIIARGYNLVEEWRDSTAHAEMICIREASNNLRTWRLSDTTLYVTLEPCPMCAGAILQARLDTVVWGAPNKLLGADGSWIRLFPDGDGGNSSQSTDKPPAPVHPFHPNMTVRRGVLSSECADVMQQFFQLRRKKKEKKEEPQPQPPTPPSCLPISHHHPSKFFTKMHGVFNIMFCL